MKPSDFVDNLDHDTLVLGHGHTLHGMMCDCVLPNVCLVVTI